MRISASAATLALSGTLVLPASLVLGGATSAVAAPGASAQGCPAPDSALGLATSYNEFVEGDAVRSPDSEGAVAVGGDADFTGGFSVGSHLGSTSSLRGGASLVVGGTLRTGDTAHTVLEHGGGVYGSLDGKPVEVKDKGAKAGQGKSPIDFAKEFRQLRADSADYARLNANGTARLTGEGAAARLTLSGTDDKNNVFTVEAAELQQAKHIVIDAPAGSTVVVNVTGSTYDQAAAATYRVDGPAAKLLWNFPTATKVTKHSHNAWPGTVLAPDAAVDLGDGGPVNGSVIAKSLRGTGSAETHHHPFTGCPAEPSGPGSAKPSEPADDKPESTSSPSAPATDSATPAGGAKPPAGGDGTSTPSAPAPAGGSGGSGDHKPGAEEPSGALALTGATVVPLAAIGGAVLVGGFALAYVARRRASR
ncbi:choice-of-anchor A family protein [Streptomyces sp. NPDC059009]|uniref:choice-of-anchor A family protein n=1 Tax=Streptomyces sp. NPDC059009 TaxID=3346694 RepID=UPI0036A2672E